MAVTSPDRNYPRAYLRAGRVSHLLGLGESLNNCDARAMCGVLPSIGSCWYGSGSWDEVELLNSLAICLSCERAWRRPS